MRKYQRILLTVAGKDVFERLGIHRRCREPGKVNELFQSLNLYVNFLGCLNDALFYQGCYLTL